MSGLSRSPAITVNAFDESLLGAHSPQGKYLAAYLGALHAGLVLTETRYLDRDYADAYAAYYSSSLQAAGPACERLHFFTNQVQKATFRSAQGGDASAREALQQQYLGFVVRRPLLRAPFGNTVLRWYEERDPGNPRIIGPSRPYRVCVGGVSLELTGLAWQQQDLAVGRCAQVALWSMFQAAALQEDHRAPTVAEISRLAGQAGLSWARTFPSEGLSVHELLATIRDAGLVAMSHSGNKRVEGELVPRFTPDVFGALVGSLLRSGYPILLACGGSRDEHAICVVGARRAPPSVAVRGVRATDGDLQYVYCHDDNYGPATRYELLGGPDDTVLLRRAPPTPSSPESSRPTSELVPTDLIALAPASFRLDLPFLRRETERLGLFVHALLGGQLALETSWRLVPAVTYVGEELAVVIRDGELLGNARRALLDAASPLPEVVGVVRVALSSSGSASAALVDVLYDTSDTGSASSMLAVVCYSEPIHRALVLARSDGASDVPGEPIVRAYRGA